MNVGRLLVCVLLGLVLRGVALVNHEHPRGDVVLDVAAARSLAEGDGLRSGFVRGQPKLVGLDVPVPPQDHVDQHPPLWPVIGATWTFLTGDPFLGLRMASLLFGVVLLLLVGRITDRLVEHIPGAPDGLPAAAMALCSLSFLLVDASANGSLYVAQAVFVLLMVEALAAPRPAVLGAGFALGALLLLNHQCVVLLPVPVLVLGCAAARGERGAALARGAACVAVALAALVPWWMRNAQVFGDPFHSVNATYFLYRAGVEPLVSVEDGLVVFRFPQALGVKLMAAASVGFLKPNLLYLLTSGLAVWPMLLGVVAAGVLPLGWRGARDGDRRVLALVLCALVLGAVSVLWPATKLRYLVPLAPLGIVLGTRLLADRPLPGERAGALAVLLVWIGAVVATASDVLGSADDARPVRWAVLAGGGLVLLALPLVLRHVRRPTTAGGLLVASGLPVSAVLAGVTLFGPGPGTAYHAAPFLPDFFGRPAEVEEDEDARVLAAGHARAVAAGAQRLAGPVALAAHARPALFEITRGLPEPILRDVLAGVVERGLADHVLLLPADAPWLAEDPAAVDGLRRLPPPAPDERAALLFAVER